MAYALSNHRVATGRALDPFLQLNWRRTKNDKIGRLFTIQDLTPYIKGDEHKACGFKNSYVNLTARTKELEKFVKFAVGRELKEELKLIKRKGGKYEKNIYYIVHYLSCSYFRLC